METQPFRRGKTCGGGLNGERCDAFRPYLAGLGRMPSLLPADVAVDVTHSPIRRALQRLLHASSLLNVLLIHLDGVFRVHVLMLALTAKERIGEQGDNGQGDQ